MIKIILFFLRRLCFTRRKGWINWDTGFGFIGIILSVAILTAAFTLFSGYQTKLKSVILGVNSHVYIFTPGDININQISTQKIAEFLNQQKEVEKYSPSIFVPVIATKDDRVKGGMLRGINSDYSTLPVRFQDYIKPQTAKLTDHEVIVGEKMAAELNLVVGDSITLVSPANAKVTIFGFQAKTKKYKIGAIYTSGMYEYDSKFIFCNYEVASYFNPRQKEFSIIEIKLKDEYVEDAQEIALKWQQALPDFQINSWVDFNKSLFVLLTLEKWLLFGILSCLIVIASFNIINIVSSDIMENKKSIGIMKTLGMSNSLIKMMYFVKNLNIALISTIIGEMLGLCLSYFLTKQTIYQLKGDIYFLDKLTFDFSPEVIIPVFGFSLLITGVSVILPLKYIDKHTITDCLRK